MHQNLDLKLTVRLVAEGDQRCFGPGIATLLEQVQLHRSLRSAAASMGMAYSKAWRIIRTSEAALGFKLLDSTIGGQHGGGAVLTPEAKQLLAAYRTCVDDVSTYAQRVFAQQFPLFQETHSPESPADP